MATDTGGDTEQEWQRLYREQLELRGALASEPDGPHRQAIIEQVKTNQAAIDELERQRHISMATEIEARQLEEHFRSLNELASSEDRAEEVTVDELLASLGLAEPEQSQNLVMEDSVSPERTPTRATTRASNDWRPSHGRSRLAALLVGAFGAAVIVGLGAVVWLLSSSDEGAATAADQVEAVTATDVEAQAEELRAVLGRLGLSDAAVDLRGSRLYVVGSVPTEQDLSAVRSAVVAMSTPTVVDLTELVVAPPAGIGSAASSDRLPLPPSPGGAPPPGAPPPPGLQAPSVEQRASLQQALQDALGESPLVFDPGSTALSEQQLEFLDVVVIDLLKTHPGVVVNIVGYAGETGDEYDDQLLSFDRANTVAQYLLSRGVPEFIVRAEGRGDTAPNREAGLDRLVEIEVAELE